MTLDRRSDLLERGHNRVRATMAIQANDVSACRLKPLAGLRNAPALSRRFLPMLGHRNYRRDFGVLLDRLEGQQCFASPRVSLRNNVIDARISRPTDLFLKY